MNYRYIIAGLLCLSMALALDVTSPQPVLSVRQGEVADFTMVFLGTDNVVLSTESDVKIIPSMSQFAVDGLREIQIFAITDDVPIGDYIIAVRAQGETETVQYLLGLKVEEGTPYVSFDPVYNKISVLQGEEAELKFLVRNMDTQSVRNMLVKGDILGGMNPEYPGFLDLDIGESREVSVNLNVDRTFPGGRYYFTVVAAIGNAEYKANVQVEVEVKPPVEEVLDLDVSNSWDPLKRGDDIIGYKIYVTVKNTGKFDIKNLQLFFEELPEDWNVYGDTDFDVDAFEEKELVLEVDAIDFDEHVTNVILAQDFKEISKEEITFAGHKVGAPVTGAFVYGGSLTIGVLFVVILALVFLYIRQRNRVSEKAETKRSKAYLEELVRKAKEDESNKIGKKGARK